MGLTRMNVRFQMGPQWQRLLLTLRRASERSVLLRPFLGRPLLLIWHGSHTDRTRIAHGSHTGRTRIANGSHTYCALVAQGPCADHALITDRRQVERPARTPLACAGRNAQPHWRGFPPLWRRTGERALRRGPVRWRGCVSERKDAALNAALDVGPRGGVHLRCACGTRQCMPLRIRHAALWNWDPLFWRQRMA